MANNIDNKDNYKPDINCNQLQLDVPKCDANKVVGNIEHLIKIIRGQQVMLDKDLAMLYGVETRALNQAVKRNIQRFPADFRFQLTMEECSKSQIVTLNAGRGQNIKKLPYAFTEQGVAMNKVYPSCPTYRASGIHFFFLSPSFSNIFPKILATFRRKAYLCSRKAALGNLKVNFHCAHLHNPCSTKVELLK